MGSAEKGDGALEPILLAGIVAEDVVALHRKSSSVQ